MNPTNTLKAVENKMNNALLSYTQRSWSDTELENCLMDELRKATISGNCVANCPWDAALRRLPRI